MKLEIKTKIIDGKEVKYHDTYNLCETCSHLLHRRFLHPYDMKDKQLEFGTYSRRGESTCLKDFSKEVMGVYKCSHYKEREINEHSSVNLLENLPSYQYVELVKNNEY